MYAKSSSGTNIYQTGLKPVLYLQVKGFNPMNSVQSSSYKASLRSKIAVRADELYPGDSMDAIKERMTFTRKMYKMIMEEKNIDLF